MRTTISLDDDVFLLAQQTAQREKISLGQAISKLVRQAANAPQFTPASGVARSKYSVYLRTDGPLTRSEDIYRLMDQEGI